MAASLTSPDPDPEDQPPRPDPRSLIRSEFERRRPGWPRPPLDVMVRVGAVVLVFAGVAWWLLRPAPAPVETTIPMAGEPSPASGGDDPGGGNGPDTATGPDVATGPVGRAPGSGGASPAEEEEEPERNEVVVQAAGAVERAGVYRLPIGSRIDDLVRAAGGPAVDADLDRVNLAAPLVDGGRVWVPRLGEEDVPVVVAGTDGGTGTAPGRGAGGSDGEGDRSDPVDLNRASADELEALPGVGPATAAAIVEHRAGRGPFATVDDLIEVRGIGEAKLEQIRPHATV